jgi:hypothetical protein
MSQKELIHIFNYIVTGEIRKIKQLRQIIKKIGRLKAIGSNLGVFLNKLAKPQVLRVHSETNKTE